MKSTKNFNFRNSKQKILSILVSQPQELVHENEEVFMLTMMTNKQSLFFSTFKSQDYLHELSRIEYFQQISQQKSPIESKQLSKKSTDTSLNIKGFNFKNSSQKIRKLLITEIKTNKKIDQKSLSSKIHKIKKMSFRNSSQTITKYLKNLY